MRNSILFILLLFLSLILIFVVRHFIVVDAIYFYSLSETLSQEQIGDLVRKSKKLEWVGYIAVPLIYLVRCSFVALSLGFGVFFVSDRFEFKRMFGVAVKAEFIFLIPIVVRIIWFLFFRTSYTLQEVKYFYPLSALSIFDVGALEPWWIYPLQVLNLFELIYWILLAYFLTRELPEIDINRSITLVMTSYGTGLLIWVALVMFLTLTYS